MTHMLTKNEYKIKQYYTKEESFTAYNLLDIKR